LRRRAALFVLALVACNPYDPQLGDEPFRCGTDEPRCPDGYVPREDTPTYCVCVRGALAGDAGVYLCSGDGPHEPNETTEKATVTPIGPLNDTYEYPNGALCPASDVDTYQLNVPQAGTLITVDVTFDTKRRAPQVDVLGPDGASIHPSVNPTPITGHVVATARTELANRDYYVQLSGTQEVNYTIRIVITAP